MKSVELLAPAKDKNTAIAAIEYGCDAVFIGAPKFGARHAVGNSIEDIKEVVDFAHKFYVKVHVTMNTILTDEELKQAKSMIFELYKIGVDAIIIQDMGILKLALDNELPPIPLHMSTQCDNRTFEKVKFFDNLGVSRVILARELSLSQIDEICKDTNCEIETFVHGALCVSYSGQCYLSHFIGGRSANRGECAQACRKKYSLVDDKGTILAKDKYLLSLKDFNASNHIEKLVKSGVKSFKIEGRLKDKNYVKNVVAFYRQKIDLFANKTSSGKVFYDFTPDVKKSFNRGFTNYFLDGRKKCFNFNSPKSLGESLGKIKSVENNWFELDVPVSKQDGLFFDGYGCLVNRFENGKIYPNKMDGVKVGVEVFRNFDADFEKQLTNSKTKRKLGVSFIFKNNELVATDEDGNSVCLKLPDGEIPKNPEKNIENFEIAFKKLGDSDFYINKISFNSELPFLPMSKINELRRLVLSNLMEERLKNYKRDVQSPLKLVNFPKQTMDYRANVHNTCAKCFYENCNCEITEFSAESGSKPTELMRTKHCLKYAFDICKSPKKLFLIDEKGKKYPLKFDCKNCEMVICPSLN